MCPISEHHDARGLSELLLALPMALPVPMPGISILFGVPLMIISVQLALGGRRAWLPACVLQRSIGRTDYVALVARMQPALERFERLVRPRASLLASDWAKVPVGVTCFVLAAIITLPIPLGHLAPGTAICLLALGLMEHDGIVIGVGFAAAVFAFVIVTLASTGAVNALHHWFIG